VADPHAGLNAEYINATWTYKNHQLVNLKKGDGSCPKNKLFSWLQIPFNEEISVGREKYEHREFTKH